MNRDNSDVSTNGFPVLAVFRGLYQRVAAKLGVDPSFVSRVARGERRSPAVLAALREEMNVIREHLNKLDESLGENRPLDGQQKDGKFFDGQLLDGHLLDGHLRHGQTKNGATNGGDLLDGHMKDGRLGANSGEALQAQAKQGKPNSKFIKSRANKTKRSNGARAPE
jgi:transcriptional regulator with XRE-family HTH domain